MMKEIVNQIRSKEITFQDQIFDIIEGVKLPKKFKKCRLSTTEEDCKHSFDMDIQSNMKVSIRIRGIKFFNEYKKGDAYLFTIRSKSKGGRTTEIEKLKNGKGELYFYGWLSEDETEIEKWMIIDIDKIRNYMYSYKGNQAHVTSDMPNGDGTYLRAYSLKFLNEVDAIIDSNFNHFIKLLGNLYE